MIMKILLGLLSLSIVVVIHEFGHFIVARLRGIEVEAFSIGWGKVLFKKKIGNTEYRISLLPLGGYCKMKGEKGLESALEAKSKEIPLEEGSFYSASPFSRILVALAGPFANFIFASLVLALIFFIGYSEQTFSNKIIIASDYDNSRELWPADLSGLKSGDRITAINGKKIENYNQLSKKLASSPREELILTIERRGQILDLEMTPELDKETGGGIAGIYPWIETNIGSVQNGSAGDSGGLKEGDTILSIDGQAVKNSIELSSQLSKTSKSFLMTIDRAGRKKTINIVRDKDSDPIGISYAPLKYHTPKLNPLTSLAKGFSEAVNITKMSAKGLALLFSGVDAKKAVSGPIRIISFAGEITANGFSQSLAIGFLTFFRFISFISIALFFMNLLPIPALDGGQIVLYLFEMIIRKPLSPLWVYRYQMVGTIIILLLVMLTTTSDILFLMGN